MGHGVLFAGLLVAALAESELYVDHTFSCPPVVPVLFGFCPAVCVSSLADCPSQMTCPTGEVRCDDGTCGTSCDTGGVDPCVESSCGISCPSNVYENYSDVCATMFADQYENSFCPDPVTIGN
jgi:hypothetical protein